MIHERIGREADASMRAKDTQGTAVLDVSFVVFLFPQLPEPEATPAPNEGDDAP